MLISKKQLYLDLVELANALDSVHVATVISNENEYVFHVNKKAVEFTGWNQEEAKGRKVEEVVNVVHLDDCTILSSKDRQQDLYVNINSSKVNDYNEKTQYLLTVINKASDCYAKNQRFPLTEDNLQVIFDSVYDAILIHNIEGDIIYVNEKMLETYQVNRENATKYSIADDLSSKNNPFHLLPTIWEKVVTDNPQFFEWRARRPHDGSEFDVEVYLKKIIFSDQDAILATIRDVSERKKSEGLIRHLSYHDKLTGLHNRAYFEEELKRLDTEDHLPLSIIIADVNGLKLTNDAFGHLAGDEVLKKVADILTKVCRKKDVIARWGGDEFAIILKNTDSDITEAVCQRIQEHCNAAEPEPIAISLATGNATKVRSNQDILDIINEAEANMYSKKLKDGREVRRKIMGSLLAKQDDTNHNIGKMIQLAQKLGEKLELDETEMKQLELLIEIHDIGKAAIPSEVLQKPGPLTQEEWEIVRKHSEIGYRIATTYPEYAVVADDILAHHERFDGKGYPRQIIGEAIPIMARIVAILEAYDVMTEDHPYKKMRSHEQAIEELRRCAGSQFDPKLVELFASL